jgi:hypothetical protein
LYHFSIGTSQTENILKIFSGSANNGHLGFLAGFSKGKLFSKIYVKEISASILSLRRKLFLFSSF